MANRRHPITKAMILYWINKAKQAHPDSFTSAFADWMVLGHYAGFKKQEWMQDKQVFDEKNDFHRNVDGSVKAFLMSDFIFRGKRNRMIRKDHKHTKKKPESMPITYRFQKNNDNVQQVNYTCNLNEPTLCAVAAGQRI